MSLSLRGTDIIPVDTDTFPRTSCPHVGHGGYFCTVCRAIGFCIPSYYGEHTHTQHTHAHTHTNQFNGPLSGTTRVSRYQKGKTKTVSGSDITWDIRKSAPRSRQITTPAPHHSVFFTCRMPFLPPNQQRQSTEWRRHTSYYRERYCY